MDFGEFLAGAEAPPPPPKPVSAAQPHDVDRPLPPPPAPGTGSPTIDSDSPGTEPPPFRLSLSPPDAPSIIPSHAAATLASAASRSSLQPMLRQSPPSPTSPLSLSHSANKPPIIFHAPGSVSPPLAASPPTTSLTADDLEAVELAAMISAAVEVRAPLHANRFALTAVLHLLHRITLPRCPLCTRFNAVPSDLPRCRAICP